jgi:hypothetical protein
MKYKPGDKIFVKWDGKIVEQEILWIRGEEGRQYYHTDHDDYFSDETVLGQVIDGKKVLNQDVINAKIRERALLEKEMQTILEWAEAL